MGLHQHAIFFDQLSRLDFEALVTLLYTFAFAARAKLKFCNEFDGITMYLLHMIQTFSGELFTSFKNTLIIVMILIGALVMFLQKVDISLDGAFDSFIEFVGSRSGITLEGEEFLDEDIYICDFLKGWWVSSNGNYEFLPLPSRILTWGKTRTNFVHTTPGKNNLPRSTRYAMYATARCNGSIPRNYPMLGAYLRMADRVSLPWSIDQMLEKFDTVYREPGEDPLFGGEDVVISDPDVINDQILRRYGTECLPVIQNLESFCDDIEFDDFDGFTVMAGFSDLSIFRDRDYGRPKVTDPPSIPGKGKEYEGAFFHSEDRDTESESVSFDFTDL
jgi:hypothetical protein